MTLNETVQSRRNGEPTGKSTWASGVEGKAADIIGKDTGNREGTIGQGERVRHVLAVRRKRKRGGGRKGRERKKEKGEKEKEKEHEKRRKRKRGEGGSRREKRREKTRKKNEDSLFSSPSFPPPLHTHIPHTPNRKKGKRTSRGPK